MIIFAEFFFWQFLTLFFHLKVAYFSLKLLFMHLHHISSGVGYMAAKKVVKKKSAKVHKAKRIEKIEKDECACCSDVKGSCCGNC